MTMPWGKYRGRDLSEVPAGYLWWCIESPDAHPDDELREAIERDLRDRLRSTPAGGWVCPDQEAAVAFVRTGLRTMAKKHHPDVGGDTIKMRRLNLVAEWLLTQLGAGRVHR